MAKEPLTITVDPASELARALADTDTEVVLESDGIRYIVSPEDIFARYDVQAVRRALRQSRDALKGVDTAELLADLAERAGQRPRRSPFILCCVALDG